MTMTRSRTLLMRLVALPLLLVAVVLAQPFRGTLHAAGVVDQEYNPATINVSSGIGMTDKAQTFTVGREGQLVRVDVLIKHNLSTPTSEPLLMDIRRTTSEGVPTEDDSVTLASVQVPAASVPTTWGFVRIDVSSFQIEVISGEVLAIALRAGDGDTLYSWGGATVERYPRGDPYFRNPGMGYTTWTLIDGRDYAFRTFVSSPDQSWTPLALKREALVRLETIRVKAQAQLTGKTQRDILRLVDWAEADVNKSLEGFIDDSTISTDDVFAAEYRAEERLKDIAYKAADGKVPAVFADEARWIATNLADADRILTEDALTLAKANPDANQEEIAAAETELAKAEQQLTELELTLTAKGIHWVHFGKAVTSFKYAWGHATNAVAPAGGGKGGKGGKKK